MEKGHLAVPSSAVRHSDTRLALWAREAGVPAQLDENLDHAHVAKLRRHVEGGQRGYVQLVHQEALRVVPRAGGDKLAHPHAALLGRVHQIELRNVSRNVHRVPLAELRHIIVAACKFNSLLKDGRGGRRPVSCHGERPLDDLCLWGLGLLLPLVLRLLRREKLQKRLVLGKGSVRGTPCMAARVASDRL